jgi:PAS domain S-box-containing protein
MKLSFSRRYGWLAVLAVFLVGSGTTFWASDWAARSEEAEAQRMFEAASDHFFTSVQTRLRSHSRLVSSLGAMRRLGRLSPVEFAAYAQELDPLLQHPGCVAIGFAEKAAAGHARELVARLRRSGQPDFAIHPAPSTEADAWPVLAAEPDVWRRRGGIGYDLASEPRRREALAMARDSGTLAGTGSISLLFTERAEPGFMLFYPLYAGSDVPHDVKERQRRIEGFAFGAFSAENFLIDLAGALPIGVAGRLYEAGKQGAGNLLYDSLPGHLADHAEHRRHEIISAGGHLMQLEVATTDDFGRNIDRARSRLIMGMGSLSTLLMVQLIWIFVARGMRAEELATRMSDDLAVSNERFALAMEATRDGIWDRDLLHDTFYASPGLVRLLGFRSSVPLNPLAVERIHPDDVTRWERMLKAHLDSEQPFDFEMRVRHEDGRWLWVWARGLAIRDQNGRPVRLIGSLTDITGEHEERERLARHRAFLGQLLDSLPEAIAVKDADLRFVIVNQAFAQMSGHSQSEIIGRRMADFFPPAVADAADTVDRRVIAGDGPFTGEIRLPSRDRDLLRVFDYVKVRGSDPDGAPLAITVHHDVGSQRQALARLEVATTTTPLVAILTLDRQGVISFWNETCERLFGLGVSQARGLRLMDFLRSEHSRNRLQGQIERTFATGQPSEVAEVSLDLNSGRDLWVLAALTPVLVDGEVTEVYVMSIDISDRKKSEGALRASEERFRQISAISSDWFWEQDAELRFTYFSSAFGNSVHDITDVLGRRRWDLPIQMSEAEWAAHRADLDAHRPFRNLEYRIVDAAGEQHWYLVNGDPLWDAQGQFCGYRGTTRDITEQKLIDEELRAHRDSLKEMVELQTADLQRAKDAAERANLAKSEFLANITHELRTPIHVILSFARIGIAKSASATPERRQEYFERIQSSGGHLLDLVNQLLDLSRFEAGKAVLKMAPLDLMQVVRDVTHELEPLLLARSMTLELPPGDAVPVIGEAARLAQVVRNLLSNAIKFTPEGRRIAVELTTTELPGGRRSEDGGRRPAVSLIIADEGVGIPDDEIESIFDKFVQSSRTSTGAGGTGLGLAICREIIVAHRGTICARNRPGGGAQFEVVLPIGA